MSVVLIEKDPQYVLNQCTKYLARDNLDERSNFGQYKPGDPRGAIAEAWRFPIIDSYWDGVSAQTSYPFDAVTFIFDTRKQPAASIAVLGSFTNLFETLPLQPVPFAGHPSGLWSVTIRVPKGVVHRYRFTVDGVSIADPLNPQLFDMDNGQQWSRFFTSACAVPLELSRRERDVLSALVRHIMPFRTEENSVFIKQVYNGLDRAGREALFPLAYIFDEDVGVVNYIDKVLSREERHHAVDYHICLSLIDHVMRSRFGGLDPLRVPVESWVDLYEQMAANAVPGWDTARYGDPAYFLSLLRRHAITGAFAHPRYGGNSGTAGWRYLESRYVGNGQTLFDWARAIEAPLGRNTDYRG